MMLTSKDAQILQIIVQYCDDIDEATRRFGGTQEAFYADRLYRHACSMALQTIGEVAKNLSPDFLEKSTEIPWKDIKKMRNLFAHDYDHSLDFEVVWDTVSRDIPILKEFCATILKENGYELIRVKSLKFPK